MPCCTSPVSVGGAALAQVIPRHGLRTSLVPVATFITFAILALFTRAVITETIFAWNSMGRVLRHHDQ